MAGEVRHDELFEKGALKPIKKDAKQLRKEFELLEKSIVSLLKASMGLAKTFKQPTNIKEIKTLDKALKDINKQDKALIATRKEMLKVDKQIEKERLSEIKLAKDREKAFDRFEKQQQKNIKTAQKVRKTSIDNANAFKRLTKQTDIAQNRFKRLAAQYGVTSKQAEQARIRFQKLDDRLRKINATARDGRRDVGRYGTAFAKIRSLLVGGLGVLGVTAGIAGLTRVIGNIIGIFSGFEKANSRLKAILGGTKDEMNLLKASAKELGSITEFTASEVTGLQIEFAKLGFPTSDIDLMTESTLNAASAMGSDLAAQAALTGSTLKAFGLNASETIRVNDVLAKATSSSALDFEKLSSSMATIAPVAKSFGFSLEGTVALLGNLSDAGFDASSAATATRKILLNLTDTNGKLAKSLKEPVKDLPSLVRGLKQLKDEGVDLGKALELTDVKSVAAFATFLEGTDDILKLNDALENAVGTAERMAEVQLDNLTGDITILNSAWEGFVLSVESGDGAINNFLRQSVQLLTSILGTATGLRDLSDEFFELEDATNKLESEITPLLDRYDELTEQTELTVDEQKELDEIILKVAEDVPTAISAFDEYGKALDISTDAAKAFIKQQKQLLLLKNAEAIEEQVDAIENLQGRLNAINRTFKLVDGVLSRSTKVRDKFGNSIETISILTAEEIRQFQDSIFTIQTEIDTRNARIAQLRGEKTEVELAAEAEAKLNKEKEVGNEVKEKEIKIITDLIELKQKEISERKKVAALTEEETALKNQEIAVLQEELRVLRELGIEKEKQIEQIEEEVEAEKDKSEQIAEARARANDEIIDEQKRLDEELKRLADERIDQQLQVANEFADAFISIRQRMNQATIDIANDEIKRAQEQVNIQADIARRGGENILAEEQTRLEQAKLAKKRELERQAKEEQAIALATAFVNNFAERSKEDPNTAFFLALRDVLGVKVAASALASLFEGTEDTGKAGQPLDSKGGRYAILHDEERVMTQKQNKKTRKKDGKLMPNEQLADLAYDAIHGISMSPHLFKEVELGNNINNVDMQPVVDEIRESDKRTERALKKYQSIQHNHWNEHGEAVTREIKDKITTVTTFKKSRL